MSSNDEVGIAGRSRPSTAAVDQNEEGAPPMPFRIRPARPLSRVLRRARGLFRRRSPAAATIPETTRTCSPTLRMAGLGAAVTTISRPPGGPSAATREGAARDGAMRDDHTTRDAATRGVAARDGGVLAVGGRDGFAGAGPVGAVGPFVGRGWMLWRAPQTVLRRIVTVTACWLVLVGFAAAGARPRWADVGTFAVFLVLGSVAVLMSARLGADLAATRMSRHDLLASWALAVAVLLPPLYSTVIGLPLCWLAGRAEPARPPHLRMFQAATLGIAGFGASTVHLLLSPTDGPFTVEDLIGSSAATTAFLVAVAVHPLLAALPGLGLHRHGRADGLGAWLGETAPHITTITGLPAHPRQPTHPLRSIQAIRVGWAGQVGRVGHPGVERGEAVPTWAAETCAAIIVAVLWSVSPYLMLAVTPPMLLLQRSLLHTELLHAARCDAKTRLANPAYWHQVAQRELGRARRTGRPLSVLLVDIDHFKRVNDRFGHLVGDLILLAVADALRAATRPHDLVGRFGGEEFVVLLAEQERDSPLVVAERIRLQIAATRCLLDGRPPLSVTVSVGVATTDGPRGDLATLLSCADAALYEAKAAGRNRVHLAEPLCAAH
ncbi:GGDEF domain-containing protein [Candidatus Frankia nodulisporulans]|uniref:GGDEF domain-containing protein n=3 Tax=Candidatus Frankia nodulisporulans TaxID=2060052 RepID=UPI001CDB777D|nr:GGDEF domain-containing protein [Candidatus Frankia nodulisporulans]